MADFIPASAPVLTADWQTHSNAELILFCERDILLKKRNNDTYSFPASASSSVPEKALLIGHRNETPCFAAETEEIPEELEAIPLRSAAALLPEEDFFAACRAKELLHWRKQHRFCGRCGTPLSEPETDAALVCPACGEHYYPQIAPAVIVAVVRGGQILLAHNKRFQGKIHGLIAGFVEAGESVEQAIHREILEETGITVKNLRYFSSQCWPFPNSLMLGFYAEYASGEAHPDGDELETLGWFTADTLPEIPPHGSIARRLIDHWRGETC